MPLSPLLSGYDHVLLDLDGCVWVGDACTRGAAKAVEYVMKKLGINYRYVSRSPRAGTGKPAESSSHPLGYSSDRGEDLHYDQIDASLLNTYKLIINTTPLGMYPNVDEGPPLPYSELGPRHYLYDVVYNPAKTLFLRKGEEAGAAVENGYEMLIIQAEESWRIWNLP